MAGVPRGPAWVERFQRRRKTAQRRRGKGIEFLRGDFPRYDAAAAIVLEIALSSGGLQKLNLYKSFHVPEVLIWRNGRLEIHVLNRAGEYEQHPESKLLPSLKIGLLEQCAGLTSWQAARRTFRAGLGPVATE